MEVSVVLFEYVKPLLQRSHVYSYFRIACHGYVPLAVVSNDCTVYVVYFIGFDYVVAARQAKVYYAVVACFSAGFSDADRSARRWRTVGVSRDDLDSDLTKRGCIAVGELVDNLLGCLYCGEPSWRFSYVIAVHIPLHIYVYGGLSTCIYLGAKLQGHEIQVVDGIWRDAAPRPASRPNALSTNIGESRAL